MESLTKLLRIASVMLIGLALAAPAGAADRTWIGGNNTWNLSNSNWSGDDEPDDDDTAIFDTPASVDLFNPNEEVGRLRMSGGAALDLTGNDLTVKLIGFTEADAGVVLDGAGTHLVVPEDSVFDVRQMLVKSGAAVDLRGGELLVDDFGAGILLIDAGASLNGHGVVDFASSLTFTGVVHHNNGVISASFAAPDDLVGESSGGLVITGDPSVIKYLDLDGNLESGQVHIARSDVLAIDIPLNDPFSSSMTLSAGANLSIQRAWNFNGQLFANTQGVLAGTAGLPATIQGAELTQIGGVITLDPISSLVFICPFAITGGTIDNRGSITFNNNTTIGFGANFQMGSASRVTVNGTMTVVGASWNWDGDGGADNILNIGGTLNRNLNAAGSDNVWSGEMNLAGGTLNIQATFSNWGNEGAINVSSPAQSTIAGDRLIQTAGTFHVLALAQANMNAPSTWTGGTLQVDGTFLFNQTTLLNGASITGDGALEFHQNAQVDTATTIAMADGTTIFAAGSATTLVADLTVDNELTTVQVGADFSGGGALINDGVLQLADGIVASDMGVIVENRGTLQLGASPGQVQIGAFEQSDAGTWLLEIGGVGANDFDRLSVTGIAVLDGTLALSLVDGYAPTLGQTLNILLAPGGVTGTFDDVLQPATLPSGLTFDVLYGTTLVQLMVVSAPAFSADFDEDGDVDAADLVKWQAGFGTSGTATHMQGDADGDADVDGSDFLTWQRQLGTAVPGVSANAPVPEPATSMLLIVTAIGIRQIGGRMRQELDSA